MQIGQHRVLLMFVAGVLGLSSPGLAAMKKYAIQRNVLAQYEGLSQFRSAPPFWNSYEFGGSARSVPDLFLPGTFPISEGSVALIGESGGSPVLKKLDIRSSGSHSIWFVESFFVRQLLLNLRETLQTGPAANAAGSGSTASSITWSRVSGWEVTGSLWCRPYSISCPDWSQLVGQDYLDIGTTEPTLISSNYDLGTWVFHGTGFRDYTGFITWTAVSQGNTIVRYRGALRPTTGVPAIPLLGLAICTGGFLAAQLSLRRGDRRGR